MLSEPHVFKDERSKAAVSQTVKQVIAIAKAINEDIPPNMKQRHCSTCRCFPMTAAERQKAYRERHKAK